MPMLMPLKLKYRSPGVLLHRMGIDPPQGTWVYKAKGYGRSGGNAGSKSKKVTVGPHARAYGPPWTR